MTVFTLGLWMAVSVTYIRQKFNYTHDMYTNFKHLDLLYTSFLSLLVITALTCLSFI